MKAPACLFSELMISSNLWIPSSINNEVSADFNILMALCYPVLHECSGSRIPSWVVLTFSFGGINSQVTSWERSRKNIDGTIMRHSQRSLKTIPFIFSNICFAELDEAGANCVSFVICRRAIHSLRANTWLLHRTSVAESLGRARCAQRAQSPRFKKENTNDQRRRLRLELLPWKCTERTNIDLWAEKKKM